MALAFQRKILSDGINFTSITDTRFKTNFISINLITDLNKSTAALNAVIPAVLSKSNSKFPTITSINRKLTELYGANINGDVAKIGDSQCITLSASCIADKYALEGELITAETTDVLLDCLLKPYIENNGFFEQSFQLNKQELIDDIDAEINEKRTYAVIRAGKKIYEGEPASITSRGDREEAVALTAVTAYEQYLSLLATSKIEVFFVGGGDYKVPLSKISSEMLKIKRKKKEFNGTKLSLVKPEIAEIIENLDVAQNKMVMAFKTNYKNLPAIRLFNFIFGATPFSKLFVNVREKLSLCYYCAASFDDKKGVIMVDSGVEKDNISEAREEILKQLASITANDFTDEEVENSKLSIINIYKSLKDSPYSLANWYLKQAYSGTNFAPEDEISRIKAITRKEIIEAGNSMKLDTVYILTGKEDL